MIEIQRVSKQFSPSKKVLQAVSLTIETGEKCCIIGMSGMGKSVLMKLILGLETFQEGEIIIDNQKIKHFSQREWRKLLHHFGVVFQGSALFDSLNILENVGIKLYEEKQHKNEEIQAKVVAALQKVGLSEQILFQFPNELSGGMQKRVAIARAILHEPSYLIYDEPTTGLDPITSDLIDALMLELAQEPKRTSIIVTHDLDTVQNIANKVVFLHQQKVYFAGSPQDFFRSQDAEVQRFLNRSRTKYSF
ncbi:MAG: ABC transporter ATP-binding protein [Bacteroidia bacterium]